jgi:hypothetical protein
LVRTVAILNVIALAAEWGSERLAGGISLWDSRPGSVLAMGCTVRWSDRNQQTASSKTRYQRSPQPLLLEFWQMTKANWRHEEWLPADRFVPVPLSLRPGSDNALLRSYPAIACSNTLL